MPNSLRTIQEITREALRVFHNNVKIPKLVTREYDDRFAQRGAKNGTTLQIRLPNQYTVGTGRTITPQDTTENKVDLVVATQKHVPMTFFSDELALSMDDFSERVIRPAITQLSDAVDADLAAQFAQGVWNSVGTPGTVPTGLSTYLNAGALMSESTTPRDNRRYMLVTPAAEATLVDNLKGLFHSSGQIAEQYEEGMMGRTAGFDWYMCQGLWRRAVGPFGGTPTTTGAQLGTPPGNPQDTFNLVTGGWTAAAALRTRAGDKFTLATVFAVNPATKQSTGALQQFTVMADTSSDGAGAATIPITPTPIFSGPYQNVTSVTNNIPAATALTFVGTANTQTPQLLAFHKEAATFVSADLEMPKGTDMAYRARMDNMSMRIVRDFDTINDRFLCRVDILYGFKVQRPYYACVVQS